MTKLGQQHGSANSAAPSWAVAFALIGLLILVGCGRQSAAGTTTADPGADEAAGAASAGARTGGALAAADERAFTQESAAEDVAAKDDDKKKDRHVDHWKGVSFDVHNFDEVLDYVTTYYIDDKIPRKRAWIASANNALGLLEPEAELLPSAFIDKRRSLAVEEGRLDGLTEPFVCNGKPIAGVVLHHIPSLKYLRAKRKKRKRLSDEEILELRKRTKARHAEYVAGWAPIKFERAQFNCAMALARRVLTGDDRRQAAGLPGRKAVDTKGMQIYVWPPKALITGVSNRLDHLQRLASARPVGAPGGAARAAAAVAPAKDKAGKDAPIGLYDVEPPKKQKKEDRRPKPDMNRAWLAAAAAYLYALDPHSAVISRAAWDESTRQTQDSSFEGIGAVLYQREKVTVIENPMEGLPAWKANVRAGDRIIRVDGVDVRGWMLGKVVKVIRGPKGKTVVLTVEREGVPEPFDIPIIRDHIEIKNVTGNLLKDHPGVAMVKMNGFIPRSTRDLRDKIDELARKAPGGKLKGLILDLRRNSGGLLNRAIDIADMFLSKGRIVSVKSRRARRRRGRNVPEEVYEARDQPSDLRLPLVVLVNDGSASASEIVASAIQDNGRGLVLGLRTFGKASVQTLFEPALHLDYYIKLTVARYYAPTGRTIQVTGVHPDRVLAPKADGKIPVGFREENLTNHLEPLKSPDASPWAPHMASLDACVDRHGRAMAIVKREKNPQIQPDFQMLKAADYATCLGRLKMGR